ncbi:MAG: flagellar protein FliS [Gammaproteobacteria bacterium]
MNNFSHSGLSEYRNVGAIGSVESADPHKLVRLLYEGLSAALSTARGAIERGDQQSKSIAISKAAGIIDALRSSVDTQRGGAIAENLQRLYDYMGRKLTGANLHNDMDALHEVAKVNVILSAAWNTIPEAVRQQTAAA